MIRYHAISIEENDLLYGPGKRVVLWVQGCSLHCDGCTNEHLWDKNGGKDISAEELVRLCLHDEIEGITLHGGEPAEQIDSLLPAIKTIHDAKKSVILFTGYEIEEFTAENQKEFLIYCDLIICGRFDIKKLNRYLHFRGSDNQRIIKNTNRFKDYEIRDGQNMVLMQFDFDGDIIVKGFPDAELLSSVRTNKKE